MKLKTISLVVVLGITIFFTGCATEKNVTEERNIADVENTIDSVESLEDEYVENLKNMEELTLDFIQQPEELIVYNKETLDRFIELNQEYDMIMQEYAPESIEDTPDEANEVLDEMEKIFKSSKKVDNLDLIQSIFDEIATLKAVKTIPTPSDNFADNTLFGFDLIDDKNLGIEGNSNEEYIRYLGVMENNQIFIPIVEKHDDHEHIYYAIATISEELFNKLKEIADKF